MGSLFYYTCYAVVYQHYGVYQQSGMLRPVFHKNFAVQGDIGRHGVRGTQAPAQLENA